MKETPSTSFVHDPRQRYSYELRPDALLDAALRAIAARLEAAGLIAPGAATAPRFHPHLTMLRSASPSHTAALAAAVQLAGAARELDLRSADTFGVGRIVYVEPADGGPLHAARAAVAQAIPEEELDPVMLARPWTPHLTLAYAVAEPLRVAALKQVSAELPLTGSLASVEVWDLDVRPTVLVHRVEL
ncbi:MAG: 2-5 ligase superfamily [Thermoleophilia bacterium]|nr:2-5 ligase superfamily [Thermoleophilia bacterium]